MGYAGPRVKRTVLVTGGVAADRCRDRARVWRRGAWRVVIHHHQLRRRRCARRWRTSLIRRWRISTVAGDLADPAGDLPRGARGVLGSRSTGWSIAPRCSSSIGPGLSIRRSSRPLGDQPFRAGRAGVRAGEAGRSSATARWSICSTRRSPTSIRISSAIPAPRSRWKARRRCLPRHWRHGSASTRCRPVSRCRAATRARRSSPPSRARTCSRRPVPSRDCARGRMAARRAGDHRPKPVCR